ncbi:MAG: hypothetical protein AB1479_09780 [Pseudomonadota bacterium]
MRPLMLTTLLAGTALAPFPTHATELIVKPSAIFDTVIYGDDAGGEGTHMIQEALGIYNVHGGHEHEGEGAEAGGGHSHGGTLDRGFNFRGAELAINAQLTGWLDGRFLFTTDGKDDEVEEAWLRTQFLPGGLQLKGGKMFSDVGYMNSQHPHAWDFVDAALPYQMLLGGNLGGIGLQANWIAPTPFYLRFGAEALTGDNQGIAAHVGSQYGFETSSGGVADVSFEDKPRWPNVWTAFVKGGGEIAANHEILGGLSWIHSGHHQELHQFHPGINDADHGLEGEVSMWGADVLYKFDAAGADGQGDIKVQAEYWRQNKDMTLTFHETKPWNLGMPRDLTVDGAYVQALYGIAPRWQIGLRYDIAGMTHKAVRSGAPTSCAPPYQAIPCPRQTSEFDSMDRISAVATWNISHNQRLRLQLSHASVPVGEDINGDGKDEAVRKTFNQVFLQYQIGLGAHGAHGF